MTSITWHENIGCEILDKGNVNHYCHVCGMSVANAPFIQLYSVKYLRICLFCIKEKTDTIDNCLRRMDKNLKQTVLEQRFLKSI